MTVYIYDGWTSDNVQDMAVKYRDTQWLVRKNGEEGIYEFTHPLMLMFDKHQKRADHNLGKTKSYMEVLKSGDAYTLSSQRYKWVSNGKYLDFVISC